MNPKQKKLLLVWSVLVIGIAVLYLSCTGAILAEDRQHTENEWERRLADAEALSAQYRASADTSALSVEAATYVKSIDGIDIKNSQFQVTFEVLFCWDEKAPPDFDMEENFRIYNGKLTEKEKLADYTSAGKRYQIFHVSANVKEVFSTKRFPLGSYQLRFYIQPKGDIREIHLLPMERQYSGAESQLNVSGFDVRRTSVSGFYYRKPTSKWYQMPKGDEDGRVFSELLTSIELKRSSWGLYFKCIISLLGISIWGFLCLHLSVFHEKDGIGLIPPVLFGMVSNIMVGANLVPDALETGLLEYINLWGIYTIIIVSVVMAKVSHLRKTDAAFARLFGKVLMTELALTVLAGHLILPVCAYGW